MQTVSVSRRSVSVRSGFENPATSVWDAIRESDGGGSSRSEAGEVVTYDRALSVPAFFQAVSAISGDVAKLPLGSYRRDDNGGRRLDREHKLFGLIALTGQPNAEVNAYKFWRRLMISALTFQNGYAWIERNGRGEVLGLYNLLPDRTSPVRYRGKPYYLTEVSGKLEALPAADVLHVEGLTMDGFHCPALFIQFRELIGGALAKRRFGSKFFGSAMTAGGFLQVPPGTAKDAIEKVENKIAERHSGTRSAFKTMVLRDGFKWHSTQVDPEKGQLMQSTEHDAREIARLFNLRPSRLGVEGSASYNSDESAKRDYHDGTLSHWLIGIRSECNAKLRSDAEKVGDALFLDYNINALSWADAITRSEIANAGIMSGRFNPNETRAWENLNPYDGGDTFRAPVNLEAVDGSDGDDEPAEDPPADPAAGDDEPKRSTDLADARMLAAYGLAVDTVTRCQNRLRIKAERAKGYAGDAVAAERAAVLEILTPAAVILGRTAGNIFDELAAEAVGGTTDGKA